MQVIERRLSPIVRDCGEVVWRSWRIIELSGVVVGLEAGPWKTAMGHARMFDAEAGGWTDEQTSVARCSFWCGERWLNLD